MKAISFKTWVIILNILMVIGIAVLLIVMNMPKEQGAKAEAGPTLDEMVEHSFQTAEVTTDLKDGSFVRIQFHIVTDSEEATEEVKKREFQLQNLLIKELAKMDKEVFQTGLSDLEKSLTDKLNQKMQDGKIIDVYTINKVLQ